MTGPLTPAPGAADQGPPPGAPYVLADLGGRRVGVPLGALLEVADLAEVAPAPLAPRWLLGVTNLRGTVAPVVDLAALAGWEAGATGRRALVLRDGRFRLVLPVTRVQVVRWLEVTPAGDAEAAEPAMLQEMLVDGRPVWIVDAEAVLARVRQGEPVGMAGR